MPIRRVSGKPAEDMDLSKFQLDPSEFADYSDADFEQDNYENFIEDTREARAERNALAEQRRAERAAQKAESQRLEAEKSANASRLEADAAAFLAAKDPEFVAVNNAFADEDFDTPAVSEHATDRNTFAGQAIANSASFADNFDFGSSFDVWPDLNESLDATVDGNPFVGDVKDERKTAAHTSSAVPAWAQEAVSDDNATYVETARRQVAQGWAPLPGDSFGSEDPKDWPSLEAGLSANQVADRQAAGLTNRVENGSTKTVKQIIKQNTLTWFNAVFVVLALLLISVGAFDNLLFLFIVTANALIGIIQELRSKKAVDDLTILAEQKIKVLRNGSWQEVPSSELVQDDIVELAAGIQIPADAFVRQGEVSANEALLTGEQDAIPKTEGCELKSGSTVVTGKCLAQLTKVGAESYAAKLTAEAKADAKASKSEMMKSLDRLIAVIGLTLIPMGIALFVRQYFYVGLEFRETMVQTVAALLGMIPEGLYLLTSLALALAMMRLAKQRVLVREMTCVETLARVDVLCVDKTGTITEPGMDVQKLVPLIPDEYPEKDLREILGAFYYYMEADNDTAVAMAKEFGLSAAEVEGDWVTEQIVPFSSEWKWSGIDFAGRGNYVIGAPEFILRERADELAPLTAPYASEGLRVLLLARANAPLTAPQPSGTGASDRVGAGTPQLNPSLVQPLALICIANRIREGAYETFQYFGEQDVTVKVISGDNPVTVSEVARQAGIPNAESYIDATTLDSDASIASAIEQYTVFGRVTPQQKLAFVKALKEHGHTVAMTGDGVNDVLALKEADCGIAMASGAQAASQIANLVLMDSDFSAMPGIVAEGRRVINNIQRSGSLFLVKTIFSVTFALLTIFIGLSYPLQPNHLSVISSLTIGIPGCFLAMQPNNRRIRGHFFSNVLYRALPGGLTNVILLLGIQAFFTVFDLPSDSLYTVSAITMMAVGVMVLYHVCKPFDTFRKVLWGCICGTAVVGSISFPYIPFTQNVLSMEPFTLKTALVLLLFVLLAYPCMQAIIFLRDRIHIIVAWIQRKLGHESGIVED